VSWLPTDVKGDLYAVEEYEDVRTLKSLIQQHLKFTGSQRARTILLNWDKERMKFKKVSDAAVGSNMQCHSFVLKLHAVLAASLV
jgi:glutamate synthase domain-containing protein 3